MINRKLTPDELAKHCARKLFESRGNPDEMYLAQHEMAAMISAAIELDRRAKYGSKLEEEIKAKIAEIF